MLQALSTRIVRNRRRTGDEIAHVSREGDVVNALLVLLRAEGLLAGFGVEDANGAVL